MNLPTNTTADGTAFAVKSGERACFATMTNGGALPRNGGYRGVSMRREGLRVRSLRTTTRRVRATSSARHSRRRKQP